MAASATIAKSAGTMQIRRPSRALAMTAGRAQRFAKAARTSSFTGMGGYASMSRQENAHFRFADDFIHKVVCPQTAAGALVSADTCTHYTTGVRRSNRASHHAAERRTAVGKPASCRKSCAAFAQTHYGHAVITADGQNRTRNAVAGRGTGRRCRKPNDRSAALADAVI